MTTNKADVPNVLLAVLAQAAKTVNRTGELAGHAGTAGHLIAKLAAEVTNGTFPQPDYQAVDDLRSEWITAAERVRAAYDSAPGDLQAVEFEYRTDAEKALFAALTELDNLMGVSVP